MSGYKSTELSTAIKNYCKALAGQYGVDSTKESFEVTTPKETKLKQAIMVGNDVLNRINMFDVEQTQGQAVTIGSDQLSTGRVETGRFEGSDPDIDGYEYQLYPTDTVIQIAWARMAAWLNADGSKFMKLLNEYVNLQIGADIVRVGFNGKFYAKKTDPNKYPNGEDINEGWQAYVERVEPSQIVKDDGEGGEIYFDVDGTVDAGGKPLYTYKTIDAMASDLKNNVLHEKFRNSPDLIVLVGSDLVSAQSYKLYSEADRPTEHIAAQQLTHSIAGMPAYTVPYFPGKRLVITSWKNLSVYDQKGSKRRKVKDNDDKACLESTYWRMEDFMVEEPLKYAAFDENSVVMGPKDSAPAAPEITTPPSDATATVGDTATFTVVATNTTAYEWTLESAEAGDGTATCAIDTTGMTPGEYTVTVTCNGAGGSKDATAKLTVASA